MANANGGVLERSLDFFTLPFSFTKSYPCNKKLARHSKCLNLAFVFQRNVSSEIFSNYRK